MNSLFARTLLWFIGIAILTVVSLVVAAALSFNPGGRRPAPFGALIALQLFEARFAYETGGPQALAHALRRFQRITGATGMLTDEYGRDLVTGEDRTELLRAAGQRRRSRWLPSFSNPNPITVGRRSPDGRYFYLLILQRENVVSWFLQPELHLAILALLALLCYAFARQLTQPVRRLQAAVDCFGRGDFTARVRSTRKDELGQLARTFDGMADRIQTLLTAERRLLLDISHELRSPLARLSVAVELARADNDSEKHLNRIQKEADRLNALVGELLQVTRAEGDRSQLRAEHLRLDELVSQVADDTRIEAESRGSRIEVSGQPVEYDGDPELLRRAIENVLRNAIRYAPAGTAVEVRSEPVRVVIRDHGPGVPDESLELIFDPFYRIEPHRDRASGGVGLGLAIAKRAVELHGGKIRAENADPGLRVTLDFQPQ